MFQVIKANQINNTISLPALHLLLRKFGMNKNDVQALESYYEHAQMRVIHADGRKSAKIPLHRSLRQDCPLSPILGGAVVNAMLRWLDLKGGGSYCQWVGAQINMGRTEVTGYDYRRQCPFDLGILQLGNGKPKMVILWDLVKYLGVRLTITGDLTFERDRVRKKTLVTIKQLTRYIYHP